MHHKMIYTWLLGISQIVTYLAEVNFHPWNQTLSYTFQLTTIHTRSTPLPAPCHVILFSLKESWWALGIDKKSVTSHTASSWSEQVLTNFHLCHLQLTRMFSEKYLWCRKKKGKELSGWQGKGRTTLWNVTKSGKNQITTRKGWLARKDS